MDDQLHIFHLYILLHVKVGFLERFFFKNYHYTTLKNSEQLQSKCLFNPAHLPTILHILKFVVLCIAYICNPQIY